MRAVKIILGIVIFFSLVFFTTGLIFKEIKYTAKTTINKPIKKVFKEFDNDENLKSWIPEIKSIEVVKQNSEKTGNEYQLIVDNQGQEIKVKQQILSYILNEKITLQSIMKDIQKVDDYVFTKSGKDTTTIEFTTKYKSNSYILGCLLPYFKSKFKEQDQKYLDNFKQFVENK